MDSLTHEAVSALTIGRSSIRDAMETVPTRPGLYAIFGSIPAIEHIGRWGHDPAQPLYVGKAERSLAARDVRTHFATGKTGRSTVRRTFASLLAERLSLVPVPRNPAKPENRATFALEPASDERLTTWMTTQLELAVWPCPVGTVLRQVEVGVIRRWQPPLNLTDVDVVWRELKAARAAMAAQVRAPRP